MALKQEESEIASARTREALPPRPTCATRKLAVAGSLLLLPLLLFFGGCAAPPPAPNGQPVGQMLPAARGAGAELLRRQASSDESLQIHAEEYGPPDFIYLEDPGTLHLFHLDDDTMFTFRRDAAGGRSEQTSVDRIPERFFWKVPSAERKRAWSVRRAKREQEMPAPLSMDSMESVESVEPRPSRVPRTRETPAPPRRNRSFQELRSEPSHRGALVGLLKRDDEIVVISRRGEWEWVRIPKSGVEGWVKNRVGASMPGEMGAIAHYRRPENVSHYTTGSGLEVVGCRNADLLWDARAAALRGDQRTVDVQVLTDLCRRFLGGILIEVWAENESGPRVAKVGVVLGEAGEGWEWPWFFASDDLTPVPEEPEQSP